MSKQFSVLSRFTAFLAVDRSQVVNQGGALHQAVQAVEQPAGWSASGFMGGTRAKPALLSGNARPARASLQASHVVAPAPFAGALPFTEMIKSAHTIPAATLRTRNRVFDGGSVAPSQAYLEQLATLAVELERCATAGGDAGAIRLVRQRLAQWVEDVRSVGELDELAGAVEELIQRLSTALAAPAALVAVATAVAADLTALATGTSPPPPQKTSRLAFWK